MQIIKRKNYLFDLIKFSAFPSKNAFYSKYLCFLKFKSWELWREWCVGGGCRSCSTRTGGCRTVVLLGDAIRGCCGNRLLQHGTTVLQYTSLTCDAQAGTRLEITPARARIEID